MSCIVCKRNFVATPKTSEEKISLFRFPFKNKDLFHRWVTSLKLPRGVSITSASRVCALHFQESEIQKVATRHLLRPNAVPTLELYVDDSEEDLGPVYMRHLAKADIQNVFGSPPNTKTADVEKQNLKPLYESYFEELGIKKLPSRRKPKVPIVSIADSDADDLERREEEPVCSRLLPEPARVFSKHDLPLELNAEGSDSQECRPTYAPYVDTTETRKAPAFRWLRPNTHQFPTTTAEDSNSNLVYPLHFVESEIQSEIQPESTPHLGSTSNDSEEHNMEPVVFRVQDFAASGNIKSQDTDVCTDPLDVCIKEEPGELVFGEEEYAATETIIPHETIKIADAETQTVISLTSSLNGTLASRDFVRDSSPSPYKEEVNAVAPDTIQERKRKQTYLTECSPRHNDTPEVTREKLQLLYPVYVETVERLDSAEANMRQLESKLANFYGELTRLRSAGIITLEAYGVLTTALPQVTQQAACNKRRRKYL